MTPSQHSDAVNRSVDFIDGESDTQTKMSVHEALDLLREVRDKLNQRIAKHEADVENARKAQDAAPPAAPHEEPVVASESIGPGEQNPAPAPTPVPVGPDARRGEVFDPSGK